jgi:uncharacterized membrane protein YphA (DoxX/SURF4 family)
MPRNEQILTLLEWAARITIAAIFLFAAFPKLLDPAGFAKSIENYKVIFPLVGKDYIHLAAHLMPALELVAGIGILIPKIKRASAWLCATLLLVFIVMVTQAVLRGFNIDCGCFGSGPTAAAMAQKTGWSKVLENSALFVAAIWIAKRKSKTSTYS